MKRHEYKIVAIPHDPEIAEETLNEYGSSGYRLVSSTKFTYTLEREIPPPPNYHEAQ
jgi:hypothetical protein